jgi:oxepin-CoA hydrolase/3-oxo-5,6-dehydrosuberyl-CoA semialdehyde dehydrogenase
MGPLASTAQREEVRKAVEALRAGADVVHGDPDDGRGAFMSPLLLRARAGAQQVHDVEAFGPVSTLLAYDSLDDAVGSAARGGGSLVTSVVTSDEAVARTLTLGLAPWHGRVLVLDPVAAPESTGHGSPLPTLVHGGPGRAGGGEELGGVRGVLAHMQRTAIQGSPDMVAAVTGVWTRGARRRVTEEHPFRRSLATLAVGDTVASDLREVTQADVDSFAELTGDTFYAHTDPEAAAANPLFGGIVAHGYLVVSLAAGLFVDPDPGPVLANFGVDRLRFRTPVRVGERLRVTLTVKQITPRANADHGEVRWDALVTNAEGDTVATYDVLTLVAKQWP